LAGSAYFVAGSYPEESEDEEDESSKKIQPEKYYDMNATFLCFRWKSKRKAEETVASPGFSVPFMDKDDV
jgi:hypothetical protein